MSFLRPLEGFLGMFQGLSGKLVSSQMISLPVGRGGSTVRVCGEFVHLGRSLVRVILHRVSLRLTAGPPDAI
jgi:hypothetical protein